ncbi:MAG: efflux transporter outer membrane subunit [Gammaproteobacteria bacterium]|jgi:NodT family efflux transporter outer membrane factor (OMF) lipoprotein
MLVLVGSLALIPGCSNLGGPEYQRPEAPSKESWSDAAGPMVSTCPDCGVPMRIIDTIRPDWWTAFGDPYLDELIDRSISGNIDIRVLAARTGVAKAAIGQAKAGMLPTVTGGEGTDILKVTGSPQSTKYSAGVEASWELDIWGKVRKGVDAQQAEYKASEADWRAGYLTLVSDVGTAYFQIRQLDEQVDRQRETIERSQQILGIYAGLYQEGLIPHTQVLQQEAEINRLQNTLLDLRRLRKLAENGLATLLGMPADTLEVPKAPLRTSVEPVDVPAGLPSDLLSRRPDIIAAEYRVLRAYNLEGQSRLAQLPSLSLTGRAGNASFALLDLLDTTTLGLSSLLSFPIFDPNVGAQIKVSEAQRQVVEEEYRRTVINAFEEVENALTNLGAHRAQKQELEERQQRLNTVAEQVYAQLEEGLVSQLEVFEVERSLLDAEQQMLANHWQILSDTIALYKALGGGWPREVVGLSEDNAH